MILGFSTKLKDKPTFFVEKILRGLLEQGYYEKKHDEIKKIITDLASEKMIFYHRMWELIFEQNVKLHTFREDKKDRWKAGMKIDFFINVRTKKMFRFAPVLPVVSTQKVLISYEKDFYTEETRPTVWIDNLMFYDSIKRCDFGMLQLANNDGFDTLEDFFAYFSEDFKGKIIHWTDLRY